MDTHMSLPFMKGVLMASVRFLPQIMLQEQLLKNQLLQEHVLMEYEYLKLYCKLNMVQEHI